MRKLLICLFSLLLILTCAAQAEDQGILRTVSYPGQDITVSIPAEYVSFYREHVGLSINLTDQAGSGFVRVKVLGPEAGFDDADYIENTWMPYLRSIYVLTHTSYLMDEGKTTTYNIIGREMIGRLCTVKLVEKSGHWVLLDRWNGQAIRYEVYFPADNPDGALLMLSTLVRSVTGSAFAPKTAAGRLSAIECAQQGFTFSADPQLSWKYTDGEGVTVYTKKAGSIPYIMVFQSKNLIAEPYEFLKEQFTPHVQSQYGDDLVKYSEYPAFLIGGKSLPAGRYEYTLQGHTVVLLRLMDSTGNHTVSYTAKYVKEDGAATMAALDAAIRSFQPQN